MKLIKKLLAVALSAALALMLAIPAFAADPATGETYTAYKIFEASVAKNDDGTPKTDANGKEIVSYTISSNSKWYSAVNTYASTSGKGMTLTASAADATTYVVTVSDDFNAADFAKAMATSKPTDVAASGTVEKATAGTTTITTSAGDGYYLITSSLGSICQLITGGTLTIVEKNTVPSITKKVWEDSTGSWADSATIDVVDNVKYQLTVNTGTNNESSATGVNDDYVITDILPTGFTYSNNSIVVTTGTGENVTTWGAGDYTATYSGQTLTITLLSTGALKSLGQNANITIEYSATVTAASAIIGGQGNTNTATLTYSNQTPNDSATVYTYEIGANGTFKKVDGSDTTKALQGVIFQLSKTVDGTTYYAQVTDNFLSNWTTTKADASNLTTDAKGAIDVKGLDAGTYTLTETATLPGYNLLKDTITVEISEKGEVTYKLSSDTGNGQNTIEVKNSTGTELPSTGGMGTTVIYTLGILLVLGAGVILVVRRRMNAE